MIGSNMKGFPRTEISACAKGASYRTSRNSSAGFTLLIAVILSGIAASVTLALTTLAYKSLILSSAAKQSQYAFYAADAALECALYYDTGKEKDGDQINAFPFSSSGMASINCAGQIVNITRSVVNGETKYVTASANQGWFPVHTNRCARLTIYKTGSQARVYSEGADVACTDLNNPRGIVRAIRAIY